MNGLHVRFPGMRENVHRAETFRQNQGGFFSDMADPQTIEYARERLRFALFNCLQKIFRLLFSKKFQFQKVPPFKRIDIRNIFNEFLADELLNSRLS